MEEKWGTVKGMGVPFLKMHKGRANSSERARGGRVLSSGRGNIISSLFQLEWNLFLFFNPVYAEERSLPWRGFVREHSEGPDSHFRIQLMFFLGCCFFYFCTWSGFSYSLLFSSFLFFLYSPPFLNTKGCVYPSSTHEG